MKKYQTIYADPPWNQKAGRSLNDYTVINGKQVWSSDTNKSNRLPYQTMTVEEIAGLPVHEHAADNSHLYLWATNAYLPRIFDIIQAWGFTYSTTLVWCKNRMGGGLGGAFRVTTEFLIFARRGSLAALDTTGNTWFNVKRDYEGGYPKHSSKPAFFHEMIERTSPGPYLELFARKERPGWDVFGNEVSNTIKL